MIDRIQKIMEQEKMSIPSFAQKTGINAATLNHIIKGRDVEGKGKINQTPSTDVLIKIFNAFPNINLEWLFLGIGSMYKDEKVSFVREPDLFHENSVKPFSGTVRQEYSEEIIDKTAKLNSEPPNKQIYASELSGSQNIGEIIIFFKDKTYLRLEPKE